MSLRYGFSNTTGCTVNVTESVTSRSLRWPFPDLGEWCAVRPPAGPDGRTRPARPPVGTSDPVGTDGRALGAQPAAVRRDVAQRALPATSRADRGLQPISQDASNRYRLTPLGQALGTAIAPLDQVGEDLGTPNGRVTEAAMTVTGAATTRRVWRPAARRRPCPRSCRPPPELADRCQAAVNLATCRPAPDSAFGAISQDGGARRPLTHRDSCRLSGMMLSAPVTGVARRLGSVPRRPQKP